MNFTYYTIIGKDASLLEGHLNNVVNYAGFKYLPCKKDLLVIVYKNESIPDVVTNNLLQICKDYGATPCLFYEKTSNFIENLYACWNLGYSISNDGYIFRGGSDQVFSKNSFMALYEQAELNKYKKYILQANTIENKNRIKLINANSRHFLENFGDTFFDFNWEKFEQFIQNINKDIEAPLLTIEDCLKFWGKPTPIRTSLGIINRVDGCSWLMTKEDWRKFGPLYTRYGGVTGDVAIHDILQLNGYEEFLVRDCVTYHFVRGESMETQK